MKSMYSVSDLNQILQYKTLRGARQHLFKLHIRMHLIGKKYFIYLSELQQDCPELFSSLMLYDALTKEISD